jgi:cobalt/nickel transport protein
MKIAMGAFVLIALVVSILLAFFVSPHASTSPDGLEKVASDKGFLERGERSSERMKSPFPDYVVPGVRNERLATGLAGLIGTLLAFGAGFGIGKLARRSRNPNGGEERPG